MPSDPLLQAIVGSTPVREEEPAPEPRLRRAFRQMGQSFEEGAKGINRGLTTDLLGAPVDMLNTLLRAVDDTRILPQRFSTQQPVGGGDWWHDKFRRLGLAHAEAGSPSEAGGRLLGGFLNPETAPMALAVLVGARAMKNAPVSMRAQYEAGRAALEAGEDPARVHRLYNVGKTKEGDYYFEPPMMQTEAAAIKQFENLYPDVKLRVLRNQGDRSGYFYPTKEGGEVFAQGRLDVPLESQHNRRRILEHELQHAVDSAEERSVGDNPGVAYLQKPWSNRYQQYLNNAAEVRARAAEVRLDPDMRQFPLVATEPVPREMQIVKQDPRAVAAAVKEPGGMWHPKAVERLADPLRRKVVPEEGQTKAWLEKNGPHPAEVWSDRALRNYLNKYAGTERDPLKDVEVPFGDGVKRWEELTDQTFVDITKTQHQRDYFVPERFQKRIDEPVYHFTDRGKVTDDYSAVFARQAIEFYLSHVGDYLRHNVPPEKLGQYDLVRAVRETAANDARVAREMEKAAAAGMKDLPVYKEYPDGFRWVELKKPDRLTPEQAKQVRLATKDEGRELLESDPNYIEGEWADHHVGYVAIGPDGKAIRNSYTDSVAGGPTPEEAWLAGRLAEEGNTMGHCVGGYCEPVAAEESRIFSLRDPKGKSHVTVETGPTGRAALSEFFESLGKSGEEGTARTIEIEKALDNTAHRSGQWKETFDAVYSRLYPEEFKAFDAYRKNNIIQIKGKQNRAPNTEYLSYVQDFVRSGKWGGVGDLGNTGLIELKTRKGKYYTGAELAKEAGYSEEVFDRNPFAIVQMLENGDRMKGRR